MTRARRTLTKVSRWNVYADDGSICGVIDHDATPGATKPFLASVAQPSSMRFSFNGAPSVSGPDIYIPCGAYRTIWAASRALRAKHARRVTV